MRHAFFLTLPHYSEGMADTELSPTTGDYTGARIRHLGNAVHIRLATPRGSYWGDPLLGSRLHELAREKDVPRVRVLARQFAEEALAPLVRDKRAKSVTVTTEDSPKDETGSGRMLLYIAVVDNTGQKTTYKHPVKVS